MHLIFVLFDEYENFLTAKISRITVDATGINIATGKVRTKLLKFVLSGYINPVASCD